MCRQFYLTGILLFFCITTSYGVPVLEKIAAVFRHGERTTLYEGTMEGIQNLELTNVGKMQGFTFGQWLREKYPNLLKKSYDNKEIYAQSSKMSRCIMTVQTVLAGLYYPLDWMDEWSGDFNINWSPVPVNAHDEDVDHMLYPFRTESCPKLMQITSDTLGYVEDNYPDIAHLVDNNFNNNHLQRAISTFFKLYYQTPDGKKIFTDIIEYISLNTECNRLYTGMLLKDILTEFNNGTRKMVLYSGHESIILSLLYGMELFKPQKVSFLSTLIFEQYYDEEKWQRYIKILFLNDEQKVTLKMVGCDVLCPREQFEKTIKHLIPVDIKKECQIDE